jgi:hypothetical protein
MAKPKFKNKEDIERWQELWNQLLPEMNRANLNLEEKEALVVQQYFVKKWSEEHPAT